MAGLDPKKKVLVFWISTDLEHQYFTIIYADLEVTLSQCLTVDSSHFNGARFFSENQSIFFKAYLDYAAIFEPSFEHFIG